MSDRRQVDRMVRQHMESQQFWQKVAGWVFIVLGGGVLAGLTFVIVASVFNIVEFRPLSPGVRVLLGIFVMTPLVAFDLWVVRKVMQYRQSRKWLAEYERKNPLPYRTEQD